MARGEVLLGLLVHLGQAAEHPLLRQIRGAEPQLAGEVEHLLAGLLSVVEAQRPVGGGVRVTDTLYLRRPSGGEQRIDTAPLRSGVHDEVLRLHPGLLALGLHLLGDLVLFQDTAPRIRDLELHRLGGRAAGLAVAQPAEIGEHEHAIVVGERWVESGHLLRREVEGGGGGGLLDGRGGPHLVHHAVGRREPEDVHIPLHALLALRDAEGLDVGGIHEAGADHLAGLHVGAEEGVEVDTDALRLHRLPERGVLVHVRPALAGHGPVLAVGTGPIRGVGEKGGAEVRVGAGVVDGREQHVAHVFALVGHDPAAWGVLTAQLGGVHVGGVRSDALYQKLVHIRLRLATDLELQLVAGGRRLEGFIEEVLHRALLNRLHDIAPDAGAQGVELGRGHRRRGLVGLGQVVEEDDTRSTIRLARGGVPDHRDDLIVTPRPDDPLRPLVPLELRPHDAPRLLEVVLAGAPCIELEMSGRPLREQGVVRVARQFDAQIIRALRPVVPVA